MREISLLRETGNIEQQKTILNGWAAEIQGEKQYLRFKLPVELLHKLYEASR